MKQVLKTATVALFEWLARPKETAEKEVVPVAYSFNSAW